jgi:hypothetical protein
VSTAVPQRRVAAAWLLLLGAAVAVSLGAYAKVHNATGRPIFTLGFTSVLQMKVWLTCAALLFVVLQLISALWMWGRLPGAGAAPGWAAIAHRWTGALAFVLTLPVAFHCIWSFGFDTQSTRVYLHSVAGCAFYGAYAAKMLGLRLRSQPAWVLPVLGGAVLSLFVALWLTSALWFFRQSGIPLT